MMDMSRTEWLHERVQEALREKGECMRLIGLVDGRIAIVEMSLDEWEDIHNAKSTNISDDGEKGIDEFIEHVAKLNLDVKYYHPLLYSLASLSNAKWDDVKPNPYWNEDTRLTYLPTARKVFTSKGRLMDFQEWAEYIQYPGPQKRLLEIHHIGTGAQRAILDALARYTKETKK